MPIICTCEQLIGGKRVSMLCELLLKPVNNDGYDATGDEIEIYVQHDTSGLDYIKLISSLL